MIPVTQKAEPASFDASVRQKGLKHLQKKGFALNQPLPPKAKIYPHWRACLPDLHREYDGTCAYLGVYFERIVGGATVDHFVAKSRLAGQAYEWDNYRLACSTMNSRKREFDTVLDPFKVKNSWFHLDLVTGAISPNSALSATRVKSIQKTIDQLGLDDAECRDLRVRHFAKYASGRWNLAELKECSPFVWYEADRQGLL